MHILSEDGSDRLDSAQRVYTAPAPVLPRCCGLGTASSASSLAPASGRALAGAWGMQSLVPLCPSYLRALHSPCSPALGQPLPRAMQPRGPILLLLKVMLELAIWPVGRVPPHAAEIEIPLMSEAPLFISPEEKDKKIKERLLTAA